MANYAIIVHTSRRYLAGYVALLNSLKRVGNRYTVITVYHDLPDAFLSDLQNADLGFTVRMISLDTAGSDYPLRWSSQDKSNYGPADCLMRYRYEIPFYERYDAVCVLDSDMWIEQDLTPWLAMAAHTDYIYGCGHEQHKRYNDPNNQVGGKFIIPDDRGYMNDLCCAPLFAGPRWYRSLFNSSRWFFQGQSKSPDMDLLNISLIADGGHPYMIPMSQQIWTGLHEAQFKAHTSACMRGGLAGPADPMDRPLPSRELLSTDDGQQIKIVHGQYWSPVWRAYMWGNMTRMIAREYNSSPGYLSRAKRAMDLLCTRYQDMCQNPVLDFGKYNTWVDPQSSGVMDIRFDR